MTLVALLLATAATTIEPVWTNPANTTQMTLSSILRANPPADIEAADDFDVVGTVERVVVGGDHCFNCAPDPITGVVVRFWEWSTAGPAALLDEQRLLASDPRFAYDPLEPAVLEVTLPRPFAATGRHFVSVQLETGDGGSWQWWVSNWGTPSLGSLWQRDGGSSWRPAKDVFGADVVADLRVTLWGVDSTPPPPGTDPCGTWIEERAALPAGWRHLVLRDIEAIASDDVWAVGEVRVPEGASVVTRTHTAHWDGATWSEVSSPSPTEHPELTWCGLETVRHDGAGTLWAAGTQRIRNTDGFLGQQTLVLRRNGGAWDVVPSPLTPAGGSGADVRDIAVVAPDDVWFVGDWVDATGSGQPGLAMRWDGSRFELHNIDPVGGAGTGIEAVSALSSNDIWAVGGGGDGDWSDLSHIFHWDGSAWTHRPGPEPGWHHRLYDVVAVASDDVWAVGQFQDASGVQAMSIHWDGTGWTQVPGPAGSSSLVAFAPNEIYAGGGGISRWDGAKWEQVESFPGVDSPAVSSIAAAGACELWAAGRKVSVGLIAPFTARIGTVARFDVLRHALGSRDHAALAAAMPLDPARDGYLTGVAPGDLDPDPIVTDDTRPLVLYATADTGATLRLVRRGANIALDLR